MKLNQTQDILAKLLATENITVSRGNVATASFDIENRILTLPQWKKLTPEIEEMLILHEVGHALYTTLDGYGVVHTDEKRHLKGYANVLEDVRIEKKMKERYPGSRKSFNIGYTQLNERDFFGVQERKDLTELLLIDKINLYYKAGYSCGVTFTAEEYEFVQRADKTVTEEDVIELAEEIFNFSKQQKQEQEEEEKKVKRARGDVDGSSEEGELDEDGDIDADLEPETNDNFDNALQKFQDLNSRTYYFEPKFETENNDPIIGYKTVLAEMSSYYSPDYLPVLKQKANTFKTESINIVNYLVKEFEMRKSAAAHKRVKISKLGQLDVRKLYAYKLKDDIFKQIAQVQEGKNHGMVFLLDWSGSMLHYMHETVEQVVNLAMFCQKIKIPYQVFAFTDGYDRNATIKTVPKVENVNGIDMMDNVTLLELYSDKMNVRDFNQMTELILNTPWYKSTGKFQLNGTPLNHALLYMTEYLGKYIKVNNVEKMNLIVLTDGESNTLHRYDFANTGKRIITGPTYITEDGIHKRVNGTTILRDPKTHKEYQFTDEPGQQTAALLNLIRDRYDVRVTGFYVVNSSLGPIQRFVKYNMVDEQQRYASSIEIQSKLRKDKAVVLKNVPGRDEMYIILSTNKISDEELSNVNPDMSATQISKQLTKMFNTRKMSRVVLNSFIGVVA